MWVWFSVLCLAAGSRTPRSFCCCSSHSRIHRSALCRLTLLRVSPDALFPPFAPQSARPVRVFRCARYACDVLRGGAKDLRFKILRKGQLLVNARVDQATTTQSRFSSLPISDLHEELGGDHQRALPAAAAASGLGICDTAAISATRCASQQVEIYLSELSPAKLS